MDAVAKSIKSILTYDKYKKFKPSIIDVAGEWDLKKHKVSNNSSEPLIILETQLGQKLSEKDIIRFEDQYNRS